jgi:hypothetical protein
VYVKTFRTIVRGSWGLYAHTVSFMNIIHIHVS